MIFEMQTENFLRFKLRSAVASINQKFPPTTKGDVFTAFGKRRLLTLLLRDRAFGSAIETGTYLGSTTKLLAKFCNHVTTFEISESIFLFAKKNNSKINNVTFINESSDDGGIETAIRFSSEPIFFWLDAHYSGGFTGGNSNEQPLRREIETICSACSGVSFLALVDDADVFDGDKSYPSISEIEEIVFKHSGLSLGRVGNILYFGDSKLFSKVDEKISKQFKC